MDTAKSLEIIESMFRESKKSLHRNSFYFILWGMLLIPAGILEYLLFGKESFWMIWPAMSIIGGITSMIYGIKESKRVGAVTAGDRITSYTWGAFGVALIFSIVFSIYNHISPHALVLLLAGVATFISGGIAKFRPFVFGGIILGIGAVLCAFFVPNQIHGLITASAILFGYVIPGFMLRKSENV